MIYVVNIPVTVNMPPIQFVVSDKPSESWYEEALWHYNHSRAHDGLKPLKALPKGTTHTLFNMSQLC